MNYDDYIQKKLSIMKSSNPILKENAFEESRIIDKPMTIEGTLNKTFLLTLILVVSGVLSLPYQKTPFLLIASSIIGLVLGLITTFKKDWSPITAPLYAIAEGVLITGISLIFEAKYPGIPLQASLCTISVLFMMLFTYRTGLIKVNDKFRSGLFVATAAIGLVYLVSFALSFFGIRMPFIHESGLIGIGFSLVVIGVAALNLLLDFDFIENASASGRVPKYMEWYGAFGLIVTLIWLYIEFLRLLSKLRDRR